MLLKRVPDAVDYKSSQVSIQYCKDRPPDNRCASLLFIILPQED
jgi:hypothetical protein